jgi:inosine triphosphate pyrophosphatase
MASNTVPKYLNFITGNKNKLAEVQAILEGVIELRNQNVDLVEIQGTVEEVTADKARRAAEAVSQTPRYAFNSMTDHTFLDSRTCTRGRHMPVLQGYERPARTLHVMSHPLNLYKIILTVCSKWFMQSLGASQLHKMLEGFDDKSAQAVCTFGYCEGPGHEPVLFQGRTDGKLVASRGSTVFGE